MYASFNDPSLSPAENEEEKKAAGRLRYELASIRSGRDVLADWGWKGIVSLDTVDVYDHMIKYFDKIRNNTEEFIRNFFAANADVHAFLHRHSDIVFRGCFPYVEKPFKQLPDDVRRVAEFFNAARFWPRYDIDVRYDRKRIFVEDRWDDNYNGNARTDKFLEWQRLNPIVL